MTANARLPIDLNDPKIPLTEGLKVLLEFTAEANQTHFLDPKRETVYVQDLVYVMLNGYLPREGDFTDNNGVKTLQGWTMYMLHNSSRSLERDGLPSFLLLGGSLTWPPLPPALIEIELWSIYRWLIQWTDDAPLTS